jgi:hypothetical protein
MKINMIFFACKLITLLSCAQRGPLRGSGVVVNKTYDFKNYNKIEIADMDGSAEIEVGKPFSIMIAIDDNLENLLEVIESNMELKISLTGNRNNKKYIENTKIKIKITVPSLTSYFQDGNNGAEITGIASYDFETKVKGNGSVTLAGKVNNLNLLCTGNGTINAKNLNSKNANAISRGNGNVYVNATNGFTGNTQGNGNIINIGSAKPSNALKEGNGDVITENAATETEKETATTNTKRVEVILKNNTNKKISLSVKYPIKGSYGIDLAPNESKKENFPVGTKLFKGNQFTTFKKPLFVIKEADNTSLLEIN